MTATYVHLARRSDASFPTLHLIRFGTLARLLVRFSGARLVAAPPSARFSEQIRKQRHEVVLLHVRDIIVAGVFSSLLKNPPYRVLEDLLVPQRIRPTRPEIELGCGPLRRHEAIFAAFVCSFRHSFVIEEVFCTGKPSIGVPVSTNNGLVRNQYLRQQNAQS